MGRVYDFTVEHRPNTQMRQVDALPRYVTAVEETVALWPEVIRDKQESKELCEQYRHY